MKDGKYLLLCGGVGGSRMAAGFAGVLPPSRLTIAVNTGDDFDHFGLRICPDLDTVSYMLSGLVDEERGWGRRNESWRAMEVVGQLAGETWFNLGDCDLGLHLRRTQLLSQGRCLSEVVADLATHLGVAHPLVPMTDAAVRTVVRTADGDLTFQEYFVRRRAEPVAIGVLYEGAESAAPASGLIAALADPLLRGIIIAPSNPILSISPILAVAGLKEAIRARGVPIVAVSPLIGGKTVRGPAAKLLAELGYAPGVAGLLSYYAGLIDGLVVDQRDRFPERLHAGIHVFETDTLMPDTAQRTRLAQFCIDAIEHLIALQY